MKKIKNKREDIIIEDCTGNIIIRHCRADSLIVSRNMIGGLAVESNVFKVPPYIENNTPMDKPLEGEMFGGGNQ